MGGLYHHPKGPLFKWISKANDSNLTVLNIKQYEAQNSIRNNVNWTEQVWTERFFPSVIITYLISFVEFRSNFPKNVLRNFASRGQFNSEEIFLPLCRKAIWRLRLNCRMDSIDTAYSIWMSLAARANHKSTWIVR